jgi:hypothetical protein
MIKWLISLITLLVCAGIVSAQTLRMETFESSGVTIRYEEPLRNVLPDVEKAFHRARAVLGKKLRLDIDVRPVIVLIHTDDEFDRMTGGNRLVTAFAVSGNQHIYIDYSKMHSTPFDLELTVTHELSHLILHEYIRPGNLPKWLNEGVSQWVSGGVADIIKYDAKKLLKQAVLTGNLLSLESMNKRFPRQSDMFILAYEESRSVVEYIVKTYGRERLLEVLKRLHEGDTTGDAVSDALGIDLTDLENDWHEYLRKRHTLYAYLSDNIYWIVFVIAALLTVVGYLKLRIRMITHFKDEDDDEEI